MLKYMLLPTRNNLEIGVYRYEVAKLDHSLWEEFPVWLFCRLRDLRRRVHWMVGQLRRIFQ